MATEIARVPLSLPAMPVKDATLDAKRLFNGKYHCTALLDSWFACLLSDGTLDHRKV